MKLRSVVTRFALLLAGGLSIGWLAGLASSPLLATLLPSVLTLVVGAATVMSNTAPPSEAPRAASVVAYPLAALALGIALGATAGAWARYHDWLAPPPSALIERWVAAGVAREAAVARVFDRVEPPPAIVKPAVARSGILWSSDAAPCRRFANEARPTMTADELRELMHHLQLAFAPIADDIADAPTLYKVAARLCRLAQQEP